VSLALVDGLQLRGTFQMAIDRELRAVAGGVSYIQKRFAFPFSGLFASRYVYVSPEKGATGRTGEVAFRGRLVGSEDRVDDSEQFVLGQTGQIVNVTVPHGKKLYIDPAKSVYFPHLETVIVDKKRTLAVDVPDGIEQVVIDCRTIPVVYGPDAHTNLRRVASWIHSFPQEDRKEKP